VILRLSDDTCERLKQLEASPAGSDVLFFRLITGGIDAVRILHERMDFGRHV
jgi:plasmid stabilization system protein ParE